MTSNPSPLEQIKDLLDELAILSEKFDQAKTEEVQAALARRIEKNEHTLKDRVRSLASREGKGKLIMIGGDRKLGARLSLLPSQPAGL